MPLLKTLLGLLVMTILGGAWLRWHYITEPWPIDMGWRRLEDLKEHDPDRLWTVHRIYRKRGEIVLIGLRRPLK
jgi:hypothetical protein